MLGNDVVGVEVVGVAVVELRLVGLALVGDAVVGVLVVGVDVDLFNSFVFILRICSFGSDFDTVEPEAFIITKLFSKKV